MAQDEDLGILGAIGATAQHEQLDHEADEKGEAAHQRMLAASDHADPPNAEPQLNVPG